MLGIKKERKKEIIFKIMVNANIVNSETGKQSDNFERKEKYSRKERC